MADNLKSGVRLTLVLANDVHNALRKQQTKRIIKTNGTVSFSRVVNDELRKQLKL